MSGGRGSRGGAVGGGAGARAGGAGSGQRAVPGALPLPRPLRPLRRPAPAHPSRLPNVRGPGPGASGCGRAAFVPADDISPRTY